MRKVIAFYTGPYAGTDACGAFLVPANLDEAGVIDWIVDWAWNEHEQWVEYDENEDGIEDEGPSFWFEDYDAEKHDMLRMGGGSFEEDFERMI